MGKNLQKGHGKSVERTSAPNRQTLELTVNKQTNQIIFTDPAGHVYVIEPKIVEPTPEPKAERGPLTVDEFRTVVNKLDEIGITWTADIPPLPTPKEKGNRSVFSNEQYIQLQTDYPKFPSELSAVIFHELMGSKIPQSVAGTEEDLKAKATILSDVLTQGYRTEFFFRYAIKVPYFEDVDWEVVIKAYERGVKNMPKTPYALLNLVLREPVDTSLAVEDGATQYRRPNFITVAVDESLLDQLLVKLNETKKALGKAQKAILKEGSDNGTS